MSTIATATMLIANAVHLCNMLMQKYSDVHDGFVPCPENKHACITFVRLNV